MLAKTLTWIGFVLAIVGCADGPDPVNSVIGDDSWTSQEPPESEQVRIATHVMFVADKLAAATPDLAAGPAAERARLIDVLRGYAARGVFPQLDGPRAHRVPRFVDPQGRLCAVGFLIATTEGAAVARDLGAHYEYARIADIDDPRLDAWAGAHGFTRHELAMIQPEYGFEPRCNGWGNKVDGGDHCPDENLRADRVAFGFGFGGGLSKADGRDLSYFLWGADLRVALTSWLAIGVGDLGVRAGPEPGGGNHLALVATPHVELSRWVNAGYARRGDAIHLDLGITAEHVLGDHPDKHPYAAEAALGYRLFAQDIAEPDIIVGVQVALADGFVIDDRVSAGSVMPFIRLALGFRP